jgi:hypothetical protein
MHLLTNKSTHGHDFTFSATGIKVATFSSVEDLNNKKAAIIPIKTAIGDGNA